MGLSKTYDGKSSEHALVSKLLGIGHTASIPVVDCSYDILTELSGKFWRIQVKSTSYKTVFGNYQCKVLKNIPGRGRKSTYSHNEVDVVAIHIRPEDKWYLIPIEKIEKGSVYLCGVKKETKFDKYENNWQIFDL